MNFSFKTIFVVAISVALTYIGLNWYFNKKLDDRDTQIRKMKEETAELVVTHNEMIGEYSYRLGVLADNLKDEKSISEEQRDIIKELEDELDAKTTQVHSLSVVIDSLYSSGTADIIIIPDTDEKIYNINEHLQGIRFALSLTHPTGDYNYTVAHDPVFMELYVAKEKESGIKIGSVRFPNNPYIHISSWEMYYDTDVRPWYQKLWDDMHIDVQAFAGETNGLGVSAGYKRVLVGPIFTEDGMSMGAIYRLK